MNTDKTEILNSGRKSERDGASAARKGAATAASGSTEDNNLPAVKPAAAGREALSRRGSRQRARGAARTGKSKKQEPLSGRELRAARSQRISVEESGDGGWAARSESVIGERYLVYQHPEGHLTCTCADYIFRGNDDPLYHCKHVLATFVFLGQKYLRGNLPKPFTLQGPTPSGENLALVN